MTDVPADTPVTKPPGPPAPPAVTVATPGLALDQDPKLVASVNWVVDPTQTLAFPVIAATVGGVLTVIVRNALKAGDPFDTNFKITVPEKLTAGVYVTAEGVAVWEVLLNVPPPEIIDHAPVVAEPPVLAPLNMIGTGVADWQTLSGPPGVIVGPPGVGQAIVMASNQFPPGVVTSPPLEYTETNRN